MNSFLFFLTIVVPSPIFSVQAVGNPVKNESFALVCIGSAPPNVFDIATVSVQWRLCGAELTNSTLEGVSVTNSGSMATLNFFSLDNNIHERDYVCVATLSITNVPMTKNSSTTYTLMTLSKFSIKTCHNYCFNQLLSYQYRQSHCLHIFKWFYYCWYYTYTGVYCHYSSWRS